VRTVGGQKTGSRNHPSRLSIEAYIHRQQTANIWARFPAVLMRFTVPHDVNAKSHSTYRIPTSFSLYSVAGNPSPAACSAG
jgi:hypothetical protein